jgi:hypothetical protein
MKKWQMILQKTVARTTTTTTMTTKTVNKILLQEIELEQYNMPIKEGVHIYYGNNIFEAVRMDPLGWYLQIIAGPPYSSYGNNPHLYYWDHPVYTGKRFMPFNKKTCNIWK